LIVAAEEGSARVIPTIKTGQDVVATIEAAVAAAAGGELTIPEANGVAQRCRTRYRTD
jgi:NAD(P)H-dependent flavin oxidoreductase YrpB (nitropropane dioxygenase family)